MATINLAPPWNVYVSEVEQMFRLDPEVHVVYDNELYTLKVYVDEPKKASALGVLLPEEYNFGNVTLKISVIPANGVSEEDKVDPNNTDKLFEAAFSNNRALSFVRTVRGIFTNNLTYVVFVNRVVQYYNDDLGDVYGQCSTLYQNIAKNIFVPIEGAYYCTDVEDYAGFDAPLGEWP